MTSREAERQPQDSFFLDKSDLFTTKIDNGEFRQLFGEGTSTAKKSNVKFALDISFEDAITSDDQVQEEVKKYNA